MKKCGRCGKIKDKKMFYLDKSRKDGLYHSCNACESTRKKCYYSDNLNKIKSVNCNYYKNNKEVKKEYARKNNEKLKLYRKEYYLKNKESAIIYSNEYYLKNSDKLKSQKRERKDHYNKYAKNRRDGNVQFKIASNLRSRLRDSIKRSKVYKSGSAVRDLGCSVEFLKQYLESLFQPGMNWDNWGANHGKWSIDHIYPLSKVDLTNRDELLKVCHFSNLRPMWHIDNIKKGNRIYDVP